MEDTRFDQLAKVLGAPKSRRLTLGALLGGALRALGLVEAEAAKSGKCKRRPGACETCKKGKCKKQNGKKKCKAGKILPKANGTVCSGGTCQSGTCITGGGGGGGGGGGTGGCPVCQARQGEVCVNVAAGTTCNGTGKCNGSGTCTSAPNCTPKGGGCLSDAPCCSKSCVGLLGGNCAKSGLGQPCITSADCNEGLQVLAFCGNNFTCQFLFET